MGRLCGRAHEISGIKAPIFLHRWVGGGGGVDGGGDGGDPFGRHAAMWLFHFSCAHTREYMCISLYQI